MTSDKAYDVERRFNALVPSLAARVTALEANEVILGAWFDTSGMANGWGKGSGWFKYMHWTVAGTNWIYFTAKLLTPGTVADGTQIVTSALGAFWQPVTAQRFPIWTDQLKAGTEASGFELKPDGTITCYGVSTGATRCDVNALVPLDW